MALNPIGPLHGGDGGWQNGWRRRVGGYGPASAASHSKKFLLDSLEQVNQMQQESDAAQQALATGQTPISPR